MVRWGNSLAVRIPKHVAEQAKLKEGDNLSIEVESQGKVAIKAMARLRTLDELVAAITRENLHREQDWGPPVGAENW